MLFSKNKSVYRLVVFFLVALCFLSLIGRNFWFEITKNLLIIGLLLPEDICLGFLLVGWLVGLFLIFYLEGGRKGDQEDKASQPVDWHCGIA